jgi:hypothetical protein
VDLLRFHATTQPKSKTKRGLRLTPPTLDVDAEMGHNSMPRSTGGRPDLHAVTSSFSSGDVNPVVASSRTTGCHHSWLSAMSSSSSSSPMSSLSDQGCCHPHGARRHPRPRSLPSPIEVVAIPDPVSYVGPTTFTHHSYVTSSSFATRETTPICGARAAISSFPHSRSQSAGR